MGIQEWVRWSRTDLDSQERSRMMATLTAAQKRELVAKRYLWSKTVGVLWTAADGSLHRARFTHGRPFTTALGEFYINSGGSVWQISERPLNPERRLPESAQVSTPGEPDWLLARRQVPARAPRPDRLPRAGARKSRA